MQEDQNLENNQDYMDMFDKPFEHVEGGFYDGRGFYCTPEGSFWDENGTYFNKEGRDKNGGFYDEWGVYNPGEGWNYEYNCYDHEVGMTNKEFNQEYEENILNELKEEYEQYKEWFANPEAEEINANSNENVEEIFGEYIQNMNNNGNFNSQANQVNNGNQFSHVNHTPFKNENSNNNFNFNLADSNINSNSNGKIMPSNYMNNLNFN